ncbi:MAG: PAS domain S-box protein [Gammaproteobacteria bacterium]|nr:PAS domain S-box protein [Gammaproteobacteria bacterium]
MLGLVTPLLIDTILIGYYYNRTGFFQWETLGLWFSLIILAAGGTWMAWLSLRLGMAPLELFIAAQESSSSIKPPTTITPLSLDELGVLTAKFSELLSIQISLTQELQYAQSLTHSVIDQAEALVMVLDKEGRILRFNRACESLTGYLFSEVAGKLFWEIFLRTEDVASCRNLFFKSFNNALRDKIPLHTSLWISKGGQQYFIEWSNALLFSAEDKPEFMVSVGIDITARKHAEEVLHENQSALRTTNYLLTAVLDTTPVMIAYLDSSMNFVRVNQSYAAADNKTPDYFIGKNHFLLYPNTENEAIFRRAALTGIPYVATAKPFEYAHHPDRGVSHWDWTLTPIKDTDNVVTGLVLSLMNVTARIEALEDIQKKETELRIANESLEARVNERTRALVEANEFNNRILTVSLVGLAVYRHDGACIFANDAIARLINATPQQMLQQNFKNIPSWDASGMLKTTLSTLATGESCVQEFHLVTSFGREAWFECAFVRFLQNNEYHVLLMASDITARKVAELALITAKEIAERANRAKTDFLSRMSHELRTPMNAILGFSQVLELENLPPEHHEYVLEIHRAGDHLLELINELLDLSRIEAGKLTIHVQSVMVHGVISDSIRLVHSLAATRGINITNQCSTDISVLADPTRLRQIMVNLLTNAVKYNRLGGEVRIDAVPRPDRRIALSVTDTGPGIPPEKIQRLFQAFDRLGADATAVDGTGIGLALSKQLAELMGATMGVQTTPAQGSTFWVELARADHDDTEANLRLNSPERNADDAYLVLYVEDNPANLRVVEALFRQQPTLKLISATHGEAGLELAQRHKPDAILLDIQLPGMDGYAVLAALRADPDTSDIPVIALSADAMPHDIEKGLAAGFTEYVPKPLHAHAFIASLMRVLDSRKHGRE